ncbi:dUTP pyrophosphatase [Staphylococcus hominis]|uniref:dUTP pyrophosphatase n=1 Tax=Staphylococcus hominis TaxID=1290 RepID=UPI0012DF6B3F|nr:dUTP pyrophosphatase [Staphylococcus hominis]MCI2887297.1 dUTP pyrophosphatase [Staphylococcus hominis]MDS3851532.1 dUTP pyrophosphatase [Staphylococcus hominis]QGR76861.1 dUTP pyrophosphatase [Staphylococcus hominis]
MMEKLQVKLLSENATMPKRNRLDAGYDIYSAETVILKPQEKAIIKTDVAINIPEGYIGLLTSRRGVSSTTHLVIETSKVDAGHHGNLGINIKNDMQYCDFDTNIFSDIKGKFHYTDEKFTRGVYQIKKGDELAQLVIVPIYTPELKEVEEFSSGLERVDKGVGSS